MSVERPLPSAHSSAVARLLETFQVVPDAKSGMASIRALIRSLAVTGRLLSSSTTNEPYATTIAALLRASKESVGDAKFEARLRAKLGEEKASPLTIPSTWRFCSIEECAAGGGLFVDGDWVESKDQDPAGEIRLTQLADVGDGVFRDRSDRFMNRATAERLNCTFLQRRDILIARMPEPLGRACVFPGERRPCATVVDVAVLRVNPLFFLPEYIALAINSPLVRQVIGGLAAGTTRQRVSRGNLADVLIPLPALAEQKRIVAKVDQLMALCDDLDARQTKKRETSTRLTKSVLQALTTAEGPEEFDLAWKRVVENFDVLIDRAEKLAELRRVIFGLAIRGALTPHGPAVRPTTDSGVPFGLPAGWAWRALSALGTTQTGSTPSTKESSFWGGEVPFVAPGDIDEPTIGVAAKSLTLAGAARARMIAANSVLMVCIGGSLGKVGFARRPICCNQQINAITPGPDVEGEFLVIVLRSPYFKREAWARALQGTLPIINKSKWEEILVPVPPVAEQTHIVSRVEQLMKVCDELEACLTRAEDRASKLVEAVVQDLVA